MSRNQLNSEFLQYLAETDLDDQAGDRIPTLNDLSKALGVSVARLREQLEVARAMGFVDVRPRTGIRRLQYTFLPAVRQSVSYAIELDRANFDAFSDLRNHLEAAYWREAVRKLEHDDLLELQDLVARAWSKLRSPQIQIPHAEHRGLHLGIFRRLENTFVMGILEAYWEAYEAVGLNLYAGYEYLQQVWQYHQAMVDAICAGEYDAGYEALVEHKDLLYHRPVTLLMGGNPVQTSVDEAG
jgi:DNA-binding FadR family transcriptional regulator